MKKRKFSSHKNHHHHNNPPNQNLVNEVSHLHSLWRRGPPPPPPHFKKHKTRHVSDKDWSHSDTSSSSHSGPGWSDTAQEQSRVLAARIQLKGIDSCSTFFDDVEEDDDVEEYGDVDYADVFEDDDVDEYDDDVGGNGNGNGNDEVEVGFFEKLFKENEELRGFYERNCEGFCGSCEFYCLVCGGIGIDVGRKFRNCVSLVHHSMSVSKNKKRKRAHRAFGIVICKVLGWDLLKLPSFWRPFGLDRCREMENISQLIKGEGKKHTDEGSAVADMELCDAAIKQSQSKTETTIAGLGWSAFQPQNNPISRSNPAQELARVMGVKIQLKGVDSCTHLFDGGDDLENEVGDVDDDDEVEVGFFVKLFEEDGELKGFYEKNCGGGEEFYCLVCGAIGNELGRKYKNCISLVEHSIEISKTKKKAHRAYGNVICKVLGWDVNKLPPLGPSVGEASCQSLEKISEVIKDEGKKHNDEDSVAVEMEMGHVISKQIQKETVTVPGVVENDNVATINAECITCEPTHGEGEVKNHYENDSVFEVEGDATNASDRQVEPEGIPNAIEKDNDASKDAGCIVSVLTHSECEKEASADGSVVDNHDSKMDRICSNSRNAMCQQENVPKLDQEAVANKMGEGSSVGSKPIDSGLPLVGDEPYEMSRCLPGELQIPK